ncbi:metallophosphoesterase family protein [Pseudoalteromonas phenolica]|uniref:Metallophosphatase n=1 Tax=Pseudoalteromonas phenolica TaxID=161398 RepID=A0A0S2K318_9GAMM|nr:metallophosphatase [Pseudoalteromonas phenolica]ALO42463.1 metallophosphatase [Pseudoalteromonas phenolica]
MSVVNTHLPELLLGPMVRRAEVNNVCLQLVTSMPRVVRFEFTGAEVENEVLEIPLGKHCFFYIVNVKPKSGELIADTAIGYTLYLDDIKTDLSAYCYFHTDTPEFVVPNVLKQVLHGSCRNPHYPVEDSLASADHTLAEARAHQESAPSLLLLSGDQIYADDVAGPMLQAIYAVIEQLGLFKEARTEYINLPDNLSEQLFARTPHLPKTAWQERSKRSLGYWLRKDDPHFTSAHSVNHLIYLEEYIAYYLLAHSEVCWQFFDFDKANFQCPVTKYTELYELQKTSLKEFVKSLPKVARLFANISTLMMFDDHDVTDDWNLTAQWEQNISSNPASQRIISNGLLSYWLFQGLGNDAGLMSKTLFTHFSSSLKTGEWHLTKFDTYLHQFDNWHYCLETTPKLVVLDTRTHRWRNEQDFNEPSGLMDWEMLMFLQTQLQHQKEIIIVSPAPVFGVKAIEAVQAIFNACGHPLVVDVENWMAHEGAARKLMDIFRRSDTPIETIILSGDVHYSFCFSVQARFGQHDNRIWQLTASGIKNEFPKTLLKCFDHLDSFLYARWSPLNFFTKRWQMKVTKHLCRSEQLRSPYLLSHASISLIELKDNKLSGYYLLHSDGTKSDFEL